MRNIILILTTLLITSCVTTKMSSFVDPAYQKDFQIKKILINSNGLDLEDRIVTEDAFVKSLAGYDVEIVRSLDLFPPTRTFTIKDIIKTSLKMNIDSILVMKSSNHDSINSYVPETYHPGSSTSYINTYGNYATVNTQYSPGYTTGGYNISKPIMSVDVFIFDPKKDNIIWKGQGRSKGNAFSGYTDLSANAARQTVAEIFNHGLIKVRE